MGILSGFLNVGFSEKYGLRCTQIVGLVGSILMTQILLMVQVSRFKRKLDNQMGLIIYHDRLLEFSRLDSLPKFEFLSKCIVMHCNSE